MQYSFLNQPVCKIRSSRIHVDMSFFKFSVWMTRRHEVATLPVFMRDTRPVSACALSNACAIFFTHKAIRELFFKERKQEYFQGYKSARIQFSTWQTKIYHTFLHLCIQFVLLLNEEDISCHHDSDAFWDTLKLSRSKFNNILIGSILGKVHKRELKSKHKTS
jgi:hypothetical protein